MAEAITTIASIALAPATGGFSLSGFLLSTAASLAISAVARALAPKPKATSLSDTSTNAGITQNVRQAITTHKIVYGQMRVGGPYVYLGSTGNNEYLHFIVALAAHEVAAIDEVWFGDVSIPPEALDSDGNVIAGRFAGVARIRKHLGAPDQTADTVMLAELADWTTAHRLRGVAYLYVRLKYDQDKFPSGIPNFSAIIKGKKVYDPRTATTGWSANAVLHQRDFLASETYGFGAIDAEINDASVIAAANIAEEMVPVAADQSDVSSVNVALNTLGLNEERLRFMPGDQVQLNTTGALPGGLSIGVNYYVIPYQYKDTVQVQLASSLTGALSGTAIDLTSAGTGTHKVIKYAEPRYFGAAYLDTENEVGDNLGRLLTATGGKAVLTGGVWRLLPAAWRGATLHLSESDFIGLIKVQTRLARKDRYNAIKGVYTSPINDFQESDYPVLTDSAAVTRDGETIYFDYDLPCTNSVTAAQRLTKIELKKSRQEFVVRAPCTLKALQAQVGDNVMISFARFGWTDKLFEVTEFSFSTGDGSGDAPAISVNLTLRETSSTIFDWSSSEESTIDPAPNTNLPDPTVVQIVTGVQLFSVAVPTQGADNTYKIVIGFDQHPDAYVQNSGQIEIQFKKSVDSIWEDSYPLEGRAVSGTIFMAELATEYDVRIRARNNLGVRSSWTTINGFLVGTIGGVSESIDYGLFSESAGTSEDFGLYSDTITSTDDYGSFV